MLQYLHSLSASEYQIKGNVNVFLYGPQKVFIFVLKSLAPEIASNINIVWKCIFDLHFDGELEN